MGEIPDIQVNHLGERMQDGEGVRRGVVQFSHCPHSAVARCGLARPRITHQFITLKHCIHLNTRPEPEGGDSRAS